MVAASGPPGHVLPALALAGALRGYGAEVEFATGKPWRGVAEAEGLECAEIPEYSFLGFPPPVDGQVDVGEASRSLAAVIREHDPEVVVCDVFTVAAALAAEVAKVARVTLVPYTYPVNQPGLPFFTGLPLDPVGFLPPRTRIGATAWRLARRLHERRLAWEQDEIDAARATLGLGRSGRLPGSMADLTLVATFPQLEYPRTWPAHAQITGPMFHELPHPPVDLPPGDEPLVVVASSTLHDRHLLLVRTALAALADEPVRILAALNQKGRRWEGPVPANARVLDWVSYAQVMPEASAVICHGGHGTVARALADGVPVLVCPVWGDQGDNGARVSWAGAGLMVPRRLQRPRPIRWATRRLLSDRGFAARAGEFAAWHRRHDGARGGAALVKGYVAGPVSPSSPGTDFR
jgi:UDP:flavonoid glycosyltransferase YjiC (YdhE family)